MSNGRKKLKETWKCLTCRTGEEESTEEFKRKVILLCTTVFVFFVAMTVFYYLTGRVISMKGTMLIATGTGVISLFCTYTKGELAVRVIAGVSVIAVATTLLFQGAGRGFGVYWVVVIPVVYLLFFGLLDTLVVGGYFWALFMLTYFIPIRQHIPYYYFWGIRFYFPYLYTWVFFAIIALGIHEKRKMIEIHKRKIQAEDAVRRVMDYMSWIAADMPEVIETIPELTDICCAIEEMHSGHRGRRCYAKEEILETLAAGAGNRYDRRMAELAILQIEDGMLEDVDDGLERSRVE